MTVPSTSVSYSLVILVDRRGWVLMQERDEFAPRAPLRWGCVGGGVEAGETPEVAAYRELAEETGNVDSLDLTESAAHFMPSFLRSDRYRDLLGR